MEDLTRRGLLTGALAGLAAPLLASPAHRPRRSERALRIVQLTDSHLKPEGNGPDHVAQVLRSINSMSDRPDVIFQGGDIVMDACSQDRARVQTQFELATNVLTYNNSIPMEHVIGNHDVWGWSHQSPETINSDPMFGKNFWLRWSGLKRSYRSFDRGGWHFVFLDSLSQHRLGGFVARLDEDQFDWFEADLARTPSTTPVCVVSHIPILSACAALFGQCESKDYWKIPGSLMHIDARRIKTLLYKHPNVKLCLSGHTHLLNKVEYNGVTHYCGGAVCGAWWQGPMQETQPGYSVIDLYANGQFHTHYQTY